MEKPTGDPAAFQSHLGNARDPNINIWWWGIVHMG